MKRNIYTILMATTLLFFGSSVLAYAQEFSPAPVEGHQLSITTDLPVGKLILIRVVCAGDNAWVDLNGDKVFQPNERLEKNESQRFIVDKQTIVLYGDMTAVTSWDAEVSNIDLRNVPNLKTLGCMKNKLTELDLSKVPNLEQLYCWFNKLTTLDFSHTPKLKELFASNNNFNSLDVSKLPELKQFSCYDNYINKEAMKAVIETMPTRPANAKGKFYPYDPGEGRRENNICTPELVKLAKEKNWDVQNPDGNPFNGVVEALEDIVEASLPIKLQVRDGILCITGLELGMPIEVYTIDGAILHSSIAESAETNIALPSGATYVLRIGSYSAKTIVP